MATPLVSVVIPTYNNERFLLETVQSILGQTMDSLEAIIVDDGSSDGTVAIARGIPDARVRVIEQINQGVSAARNTGMRAAIGEYIAFSDHDDVWAPQKIALQLSAFAQDPEVGVVHTGFFKWIPSVDGSYASASEGLSDSLECTLDPDRRYAGWIYHKMLLNSWVLTSTALIRRDIASAIGDWDAALEYAEDWDYWLRASRLCPFAYLGNALVAYRQSAGQGSRRARRRNWSDLVVERAIARWGLTGPDGSTVDRRELAWRRARSWAYHGHANLEAGNLVLARDAYMRAIRLDPRTPSHWMGFVRSIIGLRRTPLPTRAPGGPSC